MSLLLAVAKFAFDKNQEGGGGGGGGAPPPMEITPQNFTTATDRDITADKRSDTEVLIDFGVVLGRQYLERKRQADVRSGIQNLPSFNVGVTTPSGTLRGGVDSLDFAPSAELQRLVETSRTNLFNTISRLDQLAGEDPQVTAQKLFDLRAKILEPQLARQRGAFEAAETRAGRLGTSVGAAGAAALQGEQERILAQQSLEAITQGQALNQAQRQQLGAEAGLFSNLSQSDRAALSDLLALQQAQRGVQSSEMNKAELLRQADVLAGQQQAKFYENLFNTIFPGGITGGGGVGQPQGGGQPTSGGQQHRMRKDCNGYGIYLGHRLDRVCRRRAEL
jgi:hypothetical protein